MPLTPGAILFTANLTDTSIGTVPSQEAFSFIATEDIAAGEVITFHSPESTGDSIISFTVGPNGLDAFDRVTILEAGSNTFLLDTDPSGGSLSGPSGQGWSITATDNIIAGSNGNAIAAISNDGAWDQNISFTGLSRTAIDTAIASDTPSPVMDEIAVGSGGSIDDNAMFAGTNISGYNDISNWVITETNQDHQNPNIEGTTYASQDNDIFCFMEGTLIRTPAGEVAVETLTPGDRLVTADGKTTEVLWLGRQTIRNAGLRNAAKDPVRIEAGALGAGLPHMDLTVSADHGMILDGLVINAAALVNGGSIRSVPQAELPETFTYYHVETTAHEAILANGASAETFVDAAGRAGFDNYAEYLERFGADRLVPEMPGLRITSARLVPDALRARLNHESHETAPNPAQDVA